MASALASPAARRQGRDPAVDEDEIGSLGHRLTPAGIGAQGGGCRQTLQHAAARDGHRGSSGQWADAGPGGMPGRG